MMSDRQNVKKCIWGELMLCVFVERFEAAVVIVAVRVDHRYHCWVKMSTTVQSSWMLCKFLLGRA